MSLFRNAGMMTLSLLLWSDVASAQVVRASHGEVARGAMSDPATWGLSSDVVYPLAAPDFVSLQGPTGGITVSTHGLTCVMGECDWLATLRLPAGASIRGFELSACDGDLNAEAGLTLYGGPKTPANAVQLTPFFGTGVPATPGCSSFLFPLAMPITVNNNDNAYVLLIRMQDGVNMEWTQVRVRYRLQVSPAPGTATFADVPVGHPQRQFIEALVAAGITGGCGGGNYCPDTPVTRGQMAVFLAAALGLHWPF